MNKIKIGINGLGRIGRSLIRHIIKDKKFDLRVCNDSNSDPENIAYLLNYDSVYGKLPNSFKTKKNILKNKNCKFYLHNKNNIKLVDWKKYKIDYLVDCTGVDENFLNLNKVLKKNNLKNIFLSCSPENVDINMILGVNENFYNKKKHKIISSSICDSTAIAPVLKIINEKNKIINGAITTIHPALNYQNILDNKCISWSDPKNYFNTYALGRSSIGNIIPKNTSAIKAVCQAYKDINIKDFISFSFRTENLIVACADITLNLRKKMTKNEILNIFKNFEKSQKHKIIKNFNDPLVSLDFKNSVYSCNIDHRWTETNLNTLKLVLWYDNEFGYSSNLLNQIKLVNKKNRI